jgi:hypothetical protein
MLQPDGYLEASLHSQASTKTRAPRLKPAAARNHADVNGLGELCLLFDRMRVRTRAVLDASKLGAQRGWLAGIRW